MGRIIAVDFKKKQIQCTWDDDYKRRVESTEQVHRHFETCLDKIRYLTDNDREFQDYCARILVGIASNLKGRL